MAGIAVLGSGAWGTTLASMVAGAHGQPLAAERVPVVLWEHQPERAAEVARTRENAAYLSGFRIPESVVVTADLAGAVAERTLVVLVVPSQRMRALAHAVAPLVTAGMVLVSASKGLELGTALRMSQVIAQEVPRLPIVALSGPNLAHEIANGLPAAAVVACDDGLAAERARRALSTPRFRIYTSTDVAGVELGGALKNIVAIGVGISDGLGYGDNAKASFMTRALAEISRLALAAGANPLTLAGLAGLGDIIATCSSALSRNRTLGLELAQGRALDEVLAARRTVAEGVTTTRAALDLARRLGVELPITEQLARVLFEGKGVRRAVAELMVRNPKRELEGLGQE